MVWLRRVIMSDKINNAGYILHRKSGIGAYPGKGIRGVSPVISTTILLGISVTLGLALWSMVTSNTNSAGEAFTSEVTDYVNYVNERYVIVNMALEYDEPATNACNVVVSDRNCATIWIFNYSEKDVKVDSILFGTSIVQEEVSFKIGASGDNILRANSLNNMTLVYTPLVGGVIDNDPFKQDGTIYYAKVLTEGGASQVYYQTDAKPEDV